MKILELFGCNVFNDEAMKKYMSDDIYCTLKHTIDDGEPLDSDIASGVAEAMLKWALDKGATHYTHWFQPMTGITAEKHESFLSVAHGKPIMEFSGKELIKGEPDASSLPSGGIRATFEARGYTAWDPTSYAFIKDETLCIPTAFCSYGGYALDKKTPLLRSMEALNHQSLRILKIFGNNTVKKVYPTVGAEQEYFLIDKELYEEREDLLITGRTLVGAPSLKGQELNDHYFGVIKPRIKEFMKDLDTELWKLGVYAKTEHNETAPSQQELAAIYTSANIAADQNQLMMVLMKEIAEKHGLVCLLHEKPFDGVNGSGKHNNWSLATDTGENLLEPGKSPASNARFVLFLVAVIKAVDNYQDLLRLSVASAGNDHRLGANEAPPAIVSMFIGDDLLEIIEGLEKGTRIDLPHRKKTNLGVDMLPVFRIDRTDRNRTSPIAFTGNKFEFRMPGSEFSISEPNIVLNTIVADTLCGFADELEKADDLNSALNSLVAKTITEHKHILFSGNCYSEEWKIEAEKRGLLNLPSTDVAIPCMKEEKNIALFERMGVLNRNEIYSRMEILLENYCNTIRIEAAVLSDMIKKEIYPAIENYIDVLLGIVDRKERIVPEASNKKEKELIIKLSKIAEEIFTNSEKLKTLLLDDDKENDVIVRAHFIHENVLSLMNEIRKTADEAETIMDRDIWPLPTYSELLYSIK